MYIIATRIHKCSVIQNIIDNIDREKQKFERQFVSLIADKPVFKLPSISAVFQLPKKRERKMETRRRFLFRGAPQLLLSPPFTPRKYKFEPSFAPRIAVDEVASGEQRRQLCLLPPVTRWRQPHQQLLRALLFGFFNFSRFNFFSPQI